MGVFFVRIHHAGPGAATAQGVLPAQEAENVSQVARAYGFSRNTLYCRLDLKQKTGKLERRVVKARPRKIDREKLAAYIEQYPDAYLAEIAKHFHCSAVAVFYALRSMGITRKNRP